MTTTRIELSFNKIRRLADLSDLAELLFPGNRNQQHAFLVIVVTLKSADRGMVPNLSLPAERHQVSRRTLERVRAKLRRMGLIDHVSRFNAEYGFREGWKLTRRFGRGLVRLAEMADALTAQTGEQQEKDLMLLQLAAARRDVATTRRTCPDAHATNRGEQE